MSDPGLFALCKEVHERLPDWSNNVGKPAELKVWMRRYSIWEMGQGNPEYEATPPGERRSVNVGEWHITDDILNRVTTGQEVFKWWHSEVSKIEHDTYPAYTSDYLLEKLPKELDEKGFWLVVQPFDETKWSAGYLKSGLAGFEMRHHVYGIGTPLKALLKLTIALHEAGDVQ